MGDLRDLHASPNAINVITSRKMMWAGHAKRMRERKNADSSLIWKPEGKPQLQDTGIEMRKIVKWTAISKLSGWIYRVSQDEWTKLRENVPYVELYRYNPKQLYPKLYGYRDNGHRRVWASGVSTYCTPSVTPYSSSAHARRVVVMQ